MGPRLWLVANGDGGSGLGEVMQDWCWLKVRLRVSYFRKGLQQCCSVGQVDATCGWQSCAELPLETGFRAAA